MINTDKNTTGFHHSCAGGNPDLRFSKVFEDYFNGRLTDSERAGMTALTRPN